MTKEAKWVGVIAEWRSSGLSAAEFCRDRDFSVHALRHWAHRLKKGRGADVEQTKAVRLARLVREEEPSASTDGIVIELERARLVVNPGFDRATLRAVVEMLSEIGRAEGR